MTLLESMVEIKIARQLDDKEGIYMYELDVKGWNFSKKTNNLTNKEVLRIVKDLMDEKRICEHLLTIY